MYQCSGIDVEFTDKAQVPSLRATHGSHGELECGVARSLALARMFAEGLGARIVERELDNIRDGFPTIYAGER